MFSLDCPLCGEQLSAMDLIVTKTTRMGDGHYETRRIGTKCHHCGKTYDDDGLEIPERKTNGT